MKKIYSKFTKDRRAQFQIETYIAVEDGRRYVAKRALTEEAKAHVHSMVDFYQNHEQKDLLCESAADGDDTVRFAFLEGRSLCKEMLGALDAHDHDAFMAILTHYHEILTHSVGKSMAVQISRDALKGPSFADVFGAVQTDGLECACNLDIDLTFDNIIHVGDFDPVSGAIDQNAPDHYQIIDYEWVFPFEVPVNYAIYRAISAFYLKYASVMQDVVTLEDMYGLFLITAEQISVFEQMNENFDAYVYGSQGAHQVLEGYRKQVFDVKQMVSRSIEEGKVYFVQSFLDCGEGYGEDGSQKFDIPMPKGTEKIPVEIVIPVFNASTVKQLRIDPVNISCIIQNVTLQVKLSDGSTVAVEQYLHNAITTSEGQYIFANEDPQFCIDNIWGEKLASIQVSFELVSLDVLNNPALKFLAEKKSAGEWKQQMRLMKAFRRK